jgi:hypothetical protein
VSDTNGTNGEQVRRISDVVVRFVRDVGFPIAVTCYLLLSLGPKIDRLSALVERQTIIMEAWKR